MSAWGTACTGNKFPFRGTCLSQSSQEKVGQHLAFFFLTSTLISSAVFGPRAYLVSLVFLRLHHPAHVLPRDCGK